MVTGAFSYTGRAIAAAAEAGVERIVHLSVTNPAEYSPVTQEELEALMESALAPLGRERFTDWLRREGDRLGRRYVSELARNFRPYAPL